MKQMQLNNIQFHTRIDATELFDYNDNFATIHTISFSNHCYNFLSARFLNTTYKLVTVASVRCKLHLERQK